MAGLKPATRTKRPTGTDSESTLELPAFRQPQKAQLRRELPTGNDWLFEVKYDGYRAQAAIAGENVRIYSSSGIDWTGKQFAWLVPAFSELGPGPHLILGDPWQVHTHTAVDVLHEAGAVESVRTLPAPDIRNAEKAGGRRRDPLCS